MELIAILFSLLVEHFLGSMEEFRRFTWFNKYSGWLLGRLAGINGAAAILLVLLLPLLLVVVIGSFLSQWWILLGLAFSVLMLLFCFGPRDLVAQVEAYAEADERGDKESACDHAIELLGVEACHDEAQLTRLIIEKSLVEANERMFAILVWFLLLGPVGALLYRLTAQLSRQSWSDEQANFGAAAMRLHAILDWPSSHLCAAAYAFAGSFTGALHAWRTTSAEWQESSPRVLVASGLGALGYVPGEEKEGTEHDISMVHDTLALIRRAVMLFLVMAALFTLAGWLS